MKLRTLLCVVLALSIGNAFSQSNSTPAPAPTPASEPAAGLTPGASAVSPSSSAFPRIEKGNLVMESIPAIPSDLADRIAQYQNTRSAVLQGWDPKGGLYIETRFAETAQIHYVAQAGGARRQLTFFADPVHGAAPRPAGNSNSSGFLYSKDSGGGEFYQLFFFNRESGLSIPLTEGGEGKVRNGGAVWSRKGDRFAYYSTQRNGKDWDILIASPEDHIAKIAPRSVLANAGAWIPLDWSPDDRRLLVLHEISANISLLYILDVASRKLIPVHPSKNAISYGAARWSGDGKGIYLSSDEGSEFHQLRYYNLDTEKIKSLTPDLPWDVEEIEISRDGSHIAYTVNEGGIGKLYLLDPAPTAAPNSTQALTLVSIPVPNLPIGQVGSLSFSPDGTQLGMVLDTAQNPSDVYVLTLAGRSLERWTFSEVGGLDTSRFVPPTLISYPTFDQVAGQPRSISAFVYRPANASGPVPVVVYLHGGPEAQFTPAFSPIIQFMVNELGVAVIAPNVRGSSGYGKTYLDLDNGEKREDAVKDVGALLDWIGHQPDYDSKRVAVFGGSYGGYLTLASLIHFPDRLKAGIDVVGITHFVTFLEHTQEYRRDLRRIEYGDERDPKMRQFLSDISPLTHADQIVAPLFIAAGLNDPRVPASEADQLLAAIHQHQGTVWYLLAKDEGHGFQKKANRDFLNSSLILFLEHYLLK